jgi:hypothetical protein
MTVSEGYVPNLAAYNMSFQHFEGLEYYIATHSKPMSIQHFDEQCRGGTCEEQVHMHGSISMPSARVADGPAICSTDIKAQPLGFDVSSAWSPCNNGECAKQKAVIITHLLSVLMFHNIHVIDVQVSIMGHATGAARQIELSCMCSTQCANFFALYLAGSVHWPCLLPGDCQSGGMHTWLVMVLLSHTVAEPASAGV